MTDQTVSDVVGANVRSLRQQNGWTVAQLAERCARLYTPPLTAATITNIELGRRDADGKRRRDITVDELVVLADVFSVPPYVLMPELTKGLDDLTLHATYGYDVDDMIERLQALKEWTAKLQERAAKGIFGFKTPLTDVGHMKARWSVLEGQRRELEREIARTRKIVDRLESGDDKEDRSAVVRRVRAQLEGFEVPDDDEAPDED